MTRRPLLTDAVLVAALVASAAAHVRLYLQGYRSIPAVGPGFLVLSATFGALAFLILVGGPAWMRLVAALTAAGAIAAFVLSRTTGFFGFVEHGWEPQPYALISVVAEVAVVVLGVVTLRRLVRAE